MNITLAIANVTGTCAVAGHLGEVEAIGIADRVECRTSRRDVADVSELLLWRHRDKTSPVLAKACAAAMNLGAVTVNLYEANDQGAMVVFATYVLTNVFVSRYEMDTSDAHGIAYGLHTGYSVAGAPDGSQQRVGHRSDHQRHTLLCTGAGCSEAHLPEGIRNIW